MRISQSRAQLRKYLSAKEAVEIVAELIEVQRQLRYHPLHKSEYDTKRHIELETRREELRSEIVARLSGAHPEQIDWD